jgi:dephospho-CoA kinase
MTREEAERRIARQMPRDERLSYADYFIDSSGAMSGTEAATVRVYESLRRDLAAKSAARA